MWPSNVLCNLRKEFWQKIKLFKNFCVLECDKQLRDKEFSRLKQFSIMKRLYLSDKSLPGVILLHNLFHLNLLDYLRLVERYGQLM